MKNILVTGGAGFIGSNFVHYLLAQHEACRVVVYDKLTYAGNLDNLRPAQDNPRYAFVRGDICRREDVAAAVHAHNIDTIVNFAAETHVDRSIMDPDAFIQTSVYGTYTLLEVAREFGLERYHQISTDEVYGHVPVSYTHLDVYKRQLQPGATVSLLPDGRATRAVVTLPDGSVWEQDVAGATAPLLFDQTQQTGIYRLAFLDDAGQSRPGGAFAVNFFDATESRIQPATSLRLGQAEVAADDAGLAGWRELWPWLLAGGLVVLLIEWWMTYRLSLIHI